MPPKKKIDVEIIKKAPDTSPSSNVDLSAAQEGQILHLVAKLQVEVAKLRAQNDRLTTQRDIGAIKARLIEPYARNVFRFLVCYSIVVALFIFANGFRILGFALDPIVLSVLSGSTALSAIGLVGIVVRGLFLSHDQGKQPNAD